MYHPRVSKASSDRDELLRWSERLGHLAEPSLRGTPLLGSDGDAAGWVRGFADDAGHRRAIDPPLLCRMLRLATGDLARGERIDERLMLAACECASPMPPSPSLTPDATGPLAPEFSERGIETWTEVEFGSLHALSWIALRRPEYRARVVSCARWLIDNLQPDNATNRPWASHVFLAIANGPSDLALLYADTLIHNALVGQSRPDRFSAVLLLDSARWLAHPGAPGVFRP